MAPSRLSCITDLPPELLRRIAERLTWGRDVANFRLTGRIWSATVPLLNFAPLMMLSDSPDGAVTFYRPTDGESFPMNLPALQGKVVCGSSHGWLALQDVSATVTLLNPFTGATVDLPPAHKYIHGTSLGTSPLPSVRHDVTLGRVRDEFFRDIVLSSAPDSGDCVAMASLPSDTVVAFCRVGVDGGWRAFRVDLKHLDLCVPVRSIVHCRGSRFLVVTLNRDCFICDVDDLGTRNKVPLVQMVPSLHLPHLLNPRGYTNVNGELHVVGSLMRPRPYKGGVWIPKTTHVYKCDVFVTNPSWSRVNDAGDMALFVSNKFMTGLGGATLLGLTKNSIYFAEPIDEPQEDDQYHQLQIRGIADGTSELLSYQKKTKSSSAALCWIQPKPTPWTQGGHANA